MSVEPGHVPCHAKGCPQIATEVCERCGHPCCPTHIRHISIMHRDERPQPSVDASVRLPTRVETYALCPRCSTKPVQRRVLPGI